MLVANSASGEVTEWSKVQHWKCCELQKGSAGSNPALSAIPPPYFRSPNTSNRAGRRTFSYNTRVFGSNSYSRSRAMA